MKKEIKSSSKAIKIIIANTLLGLVITPAFSQQVSNSLNNQTIKNQKNMFTVEQIKAAHSKVKSGADFPKYIQEIKLLGVIGFETWVKDSHTKYFGKNGFHTESKPMYELLSITEKVGKENFSQCLKMHQEGKTDYHTFCKDCAEAGIEKWVVSLNEMTCIYFDKAGNEVVVEMIPQ